MQPGNIGGHFFRLDLTDGDPATVSGNEPEADGLVEYQMPRMQCRHRMAGATAARTGAIEFRDIGFQCDNPVALERST
jgi:hypothetical protein